MSSTETYVEQSRQQFHVRPVLPFGYPLEIGSIGVVDNGAYSHRGSARALLGVDPGEIVESPVEAGWSLTSGKDVSVGFVAGGEASTLFPQAPKASVKAEVTFGSANSCLVTAEKLRITRLKEPAALLGAMVQARARGEWQPDYVIVHELVVPEAVVAVLATQRDTSVLLEAQADVGALPGVAVGELHAGMRPTYRTADVVTFDGGGQPLFYNALRVKKGFFSGDFAPAPFGVDDDATSTFFDEV